MSAAKPTLSVCMIVRNEEANVGRALASTVGVATETVVIDTGSTDRTVEIARTHGARVGSFVWINDFSAARNYAASQATGDWILMLDADEQLSDGFRESWEKTVKSTLADGLAVPLFNLDDDGKLQMRINTVRLFRNRPSYRFEGTIHEDVGQSIVRGGGRILEAELPLLHFGYTLREDRRKNRRGRNLALLEEAHAGDPENARYWHYLGLEHLSNDNLAAARPWFERVLAEQPTEPLAGWSASLLTDLLRRQRNFGPAWDAALFGTTAEMGRVMSLVRLGEIALTEGDHIVAEWCASELDDVKPGTSGDIDGRSAIVENLRAGAQWERGERPLAVATLEAAVRAHPNAVNLADTYVRRSEQLHGGVAGVLAAMRATETAFVIAASVGFFTRQEQWAEAIELAAICKQDSKYTAHAMLRAGRVADGLTALGKLGDGGQLHALLWGLDQNDHELVTSALEGAPALWSTVATHVLQNTPVPERLVWVIWEWALYWLDLRGFDLAKRLAFLLPGTDSDRAATLALMMYEAKQPTMALTIAVEHADRPAAMEMLGLFCHEQGDLDGAAQFLFLRAEAGDAPVRVYSKGADALLKKGRAEDARKIMELGRLARPHSKLLTAE